MILDRDNFLQYLEIQPFLSQIIVVHLVRKDRRTTQAHNINEPWRSFVPMGGTAFSRLRMLQAFFNIGELLLCLRRDAEEPGIMVSVESLGRRTSVTDF